jgi:ABC-type multidrug transport system fused ATPase/permease subunit
MVVEENNRKEEKEDDKKEFNNNKEEADKKVSKKNDIIELLAKGKIELSQIFIAPAIVAFGILQILSGETSPMTWLVLSISYWLIFILTLFLFLTQYLRIITLQSVIKKRYVSNFDKEIDEMMEFGRHKYLKKIFNLYYKSSEESLFRLLYVILFIFIMIAFSLWFSVSYHL